MAVVRDKFPVIDSLVPISKTIAPGDLTPKMTPVVLTVSFLFTEEEIPRGLDLSVGIRWRTGFVQQIAI